MPKYQELLEHINSFSAGLPEMDSDGSEDRQSSCCAAEVAHSSTGARHKDGRAEIYDWPSWEEVAADRDTSRGTIQASFEVEEITHDQIRSLARVSNSGLLADNATGLTPQLDGPLDMTANDDHCESDVDSCCSSGARWDLAMTDEWNEMVLQSSSVVDLENVMCPAEAASSTRAAAMAAEPRAGACTLGEDEPVPEGWNPEAELRKQLALLRLPREDIDRIVLGTLYGVVDVD